MIFFLINDIVNKIELMKCKLMIVVVQRFDGNADVLDVIPGDSYLTKLGELHSVKRSI